MKKMFVLLAMFCLCFQATAVYAVTPDFSGVWELDVSKSTLPDTMPIEWMTINVSQTEKELKIESNSKTSRSSGDGKQRNVSIVKQIFAFNLEGKVMTTTDVGSGATLGSEERKAAITADEKLSLTTTRRFSDQAKTAEKTNEIWELLDAGETLKITRYTESASGATNAEMYFTKKLLPVKADYDVPREIPAIDTSKVPKKVSGGVLNGKAISLPKPDYPAAAKAVNASGTVNVQVTIDEQGNLISASAVSGHPLLRQAAEEAARNAKFAPTLLSGVPVKVTGVLVYNFVP